VEVLLDFAWVECDDLGVLEAPVEGKINIPEVTESPLMAKKPQQLCWVQ